MSSVIDTNVLIVANGKSEHASMSCQLTCIELLEQTASLTIVLDDTNLIMDEYQRHCNHKGSPGVGDMFFKYLHDNQYVPSSNIIRAQITPIADSECGFSELPQNQLDPSDRKFLASAVVAKAEVINATDSDWQEQQELMQTLKVNVRQLCTSD